MALHPEWNGLVQGLVVNKKGAISGVPSCSGKTDLPIVQDDSSGSLWAALGMTANGVAIVDQQGVLAHKIAPGSFPAINEEVAGVVNGLLGL